MREYNDDGSLKNVAVLLHAAGYAIGQTVERKSNKTCGTIDSFNSSDVKILIDGTKDVLASVSVHEFLSRQWTVFRKVVQDVVIVSPTKAPSDFEEFTICRLAAFIQLQICNMTLTHATCLSKLKVGLKPKREVFVSETFDKHQLNLVPTSLKVLRKAADHDLPPNTVFVEVVPSVAAKFVLTAPLSEFEDRAQIAPFWFINDSTVDEEINMQIIHMKEELDSFKVGIPIARNTKKVTVDTRLCFKKHGSKRQAEAAAAVSSTSGTKSKAAALPKSASSKKAAAESSAVPTKKAKS